MKADIMQEDGERTPMKRAKEGDGPKAAGRRRTLVRPITVVGALLCAAGAALWSVLPGQAGIGDPAHVEASAPAAGDQLDAAADQEVMEAATNSRLFVGAVHPGETLVTSAGIEGHITRLEQPDFGVFVEKGDLLAVIDASVVQKEGLQARVTAVEARLEYLKLKNWQSGSEMREAERAVLEAKRAVDLASRKRDQSRQLLDEGIIAASEYELEEQTLLQSETQLTSAVERYGEVEDQANDELIELARQKFEMAEKDLAAIEASMNENELRAPISGILLPPPRTKTGLSEISVGQTLKDGQPLFLIGNLDDIVVKISVGELDIDLIRTGQKAIVTSPVLPADGMTGVVESVSQYASSFGENQYYGGTPEPSRYDVVIRVPIEGRTDHQRIRIGMTVDVEIDITEEVAGPVPQADVPQVSVPQAALGPGETVR